MLPSIQRTTTTPTWVVPSRTRLEPLLRTRAGPLLWLVKRTSGRAGQGRVEQRGAERRGEATTRAGGGVPEKHAHQVGEADGRRREESRCAGLELRAECVCAGPGGVRRKWVPSLMLAASQPLSLSSPLLSSLLLASVGEAASARGWVASVATGADGSKLPRIPGDSSAPLSVSNLLSDLLCSALHAQDCRSLSHERCAGSCTSQCAQFGAILPSVYSFPLGVLGVVGWVVRACGRVQPGLRQLRAPGKLGA